MKKEGMTFTGKKFLYEGSINSSVIVYPLYGSGQRTGSKIYIDKKIVDLTKSAIENKSEIPMGACYDNPSPNSLGELLYKKKISPLLLSYILPLLEEEGYITHYKEGRGFWVKRRRSFSPGDRDRISSASRDIQLPDRKEFLSGCAAFVKYEKRDAMYKVATFLMSHFWGKMSDMTDALGVLLSTWNQAFYRYGSFDYGSLENCITANFSTLEGFKKRYISTLSEKDEKEIKSLFNAFLKALQIASGKSKGKKSPVAVAKALHLLAPGFFPLWDKEIAWAYGCYYNEDPADKYVTFSKITKTIAEGVKDYVPRTNKTLLKLIDEYNYSKYTQEWI